MDQVEEFSVGAWAVQGPVLPVPFPVTTQGQSIVTYAGELMGWSITEASGSASAEVQLFDGGNGNGSLLATVQLAVSEADTRLPGILGVTFQSGLYMKVVSGEVQGTVYVRASR